VVRVNEAPRPHVEHLRLHRGGCRHKVMGEPADREVNRDLSASIDDEKSPAVAVDRDRRVFHPHA
jgi:hypothetical protein